MNKLTWAESELLEVMRIVGEPDGTDDDITRLMKLTAIRRMVEADQERYLELLRWSKVAALSKRRRK